MLVPIVHLVFALFPNQSATAKNPASVSSLWLHQPAVRVCVGRQLEVADWPFSKEFEVAAWSFAKELESH